MSSTRDKILQSFEKSVQTPLSGAALAKQLGLTRASVWKHIVSLKKEGIPLSGSTRTGYRFKEPFDFSLLKIKKLNFINGNYHIHHVISVDSTQQLAKLAMTKQWPGGHVWVAEHQTQGRGRLSRKWSSPLGGLWLSILLRPSLPLARLTALALVTALALCEAIEDMAFIQVRVKWPNDVVVLVEGKWRKVAGILTEMSAEMDRTDWVIIGIGVNVNNEIPKALEKIATSLFQETGKRFERAALLKNFLRFFSRNYFCFQNKGFDMFQKDYWQRYYRPGQPVQLNTAQGVLHGVARGVDAYGGLIVESPTGHLKSVFEGEIVL